MCKKIAWPRLGLLLLLAAALVIVDQAVKGAVRANIPLHTSMPFLPGVLDLAYVQNTGAAFSILTDHTWILALVSAAASAALCALLVAWHKTSPLGALLAAVVLAGAVGNLIDRVFFGYVVDMFRTVFMDFPVFNVADIYVTCGGIALCVYYGFFHDREKEVPPSDPPSHP